MSRTVTDRVKAQNSFEPPLRVDDLKFVSTFDRADREFGDFWSAHPDADWAFVARRLGQPLSAEEQSVVGPFLDITEASWAGHRQFGVGRYSVDPILPDRLRRT